ncbi:MAG: thioesterase family protein [Ilumatobacteraceae bacterium]|nr:thioesterase family protein [Acidimicrobiales bacterium]MCB9394490.1 thioesterase family protein [Acidimicrobiaceae bacterium]
MDGLAGTKAYLGLVASDDPMRWTLPLAPHVMTAGGFLYGGAGLAAAIAAMELGTGRPVVWATAQYVAHARSGDLELEVVVSASGRNTSQARCIATCDGEEILVALATLGRKDLPVAGTWARRPDVKHWSDTRPQLPPAVIGTVHEALDLRIVHGVSRRQLIKGRTHRDPSGRAAFWLRIPGGPKVPDAADLAMVGDVVPSGFANVSGVPISGNSLDNTVRTAKLVETEWVLADVQVHAIQDGFGYGRAHLWAEDGTLLGTASQSSVIRTPPAS